MSYITDVTIVTDDPTRKKVLEYIQSFEWTRRGGMSRLAYFGKLDTEPAGGTKVYCADVYAAAFNYLPVDEFMEHVKAAPWNPYSATFVIVATEGDRGEVWSPGPLSDTGEATE